MNYSSLTTDSRFFIKRFSHKNRFEKAYKLCQKEAFTSLLDFGTGDGYFLNYLKEKNNRLFKIVGYEPVDSIYNQIKTDKDILLVKKISSLEKEKFDVITCLEVLEHFEEDYQKELLNQMKGLLAKTGRIIISVPIEIGFSSLLKNSFRIIFKQRERDTSYLNTLKALFHINVKRKREGDYIFSHVGFNYNKLEEVIKKEDFIIINKQFSPFKFLFSLINSQVFFEIKLK